ncbi:MAG: hypothetical protein HY825_05725 [Acidobacteria bacterium]|nr:hypothetical protein [Acidobacteriota bacterium]
MQKLDRLGWAAGLSFEAYGLLIGVRVNDPAGLDLIRGRLPYGWAPALTDEVEYLYSIIVGGDDTDGRLRRLSVVYADAVRIGRTKDLTAALDAFEKDLELFVGEKARGRVFVHAGVVGWDGQGIMLPGRSFSGKSTLVAALIRAGATYYSDEFAILDAAGQVHPFARPLSLRRDQELKGDLVTATSLGGRTGVGPIPVGHVFLCGFKAGARFRPRALSHGRACLEILRHTLAARSTPEFVLPVLQQVVEHARVFKTLRDEADDSAARILAVARGGSPDSGSRPG